MSLLTILKTNNQLIASYCQDPKKQSLYDWIDHIVVTTEIFQKKNLIMDMDFLKKKGKIKGCG